MNKLLILGAVAALLMAGSQQVAAQAPTFCLTSRAVSEIEATPGFSCTMWSPFGTATLSHFSFSSQLTDPIDYSVAFKAAGIDIGDVDAGFIVQFYSLVARIPGNVHDLFNYQISISTFSDSALPPGLVAASLNLFAEGPVHQVTGALTAIENFTGNVVGSNTLAATVVAPDNPSGNYNPFGNDVATLDGDTTFTVRNSLSTTPGGSLLAISFSNEFLGKITPASAPEPASLSLFGVGLAALALERRRRPGGRKRTDTRGRLLPLSDFGMARG